KRNWVATGGGGQGRLERAVRVAQQHTHVVADLVGGRQIEAAVAVEVGGHDGLRACASGVVNRREEGQYTPVFENFQLQAAGSRPPLPGSSSLLAGGRSGET